MPSPMAPAHFVPGVRKQKNTIPERIMGKLAKSYSMDDIKRVLQHFDVPYGHTNRSDKHSLLLKLAMLERTKYVTPGERLAILKMPLDYRFPVRFQELDLEGEFQASAYPNGVDPAELSQSKERAPKLKPQSRA